MSEFIKIAPKGVMRLLWWLLLIIFIVIGVSTILLNNPCKPHTKFDAPVMTGGFFDDFEKGNATAWNIISGKWAIADNGTGNKVFRQTASILSGKPMVTAGDSRWSDYTFETDVTIGKMDSKGKVKMLVRFIDNKNYYAVSFSQKSVCIEKVVSNKVIVLASRENIYTLGPALGMHVSAAVSGNKITLFVNGDEIISAEDASLTNGKVGLRCDSIDAVFDNVEVTTVVIDKPLPGTGLVVSVADFGASPALNDNYKAFQAAIDYSRNKAASKLIVPKGVYKFKGSISLDFIGLNDFTFDGQGSELIFYNDKIKTSNGLRFIYIDNCTRTQFKNFTIDWDWDSDRIATMGKVIAVNGNQFDMEFPDIEEIEPNMTWPVMYTLDRVYYTSAVENEKLYGTLDIKNQEKIGPNKLRVTNAKPLNLSVGETYLIRHYDYNMAAVTERNSSHLLFDNITLYSNPGNGICIAENTNHWGLVNSKVELKPGTNRRITVAAGILDVRNSKGYAVIKNNNFSYNGDDVINIHDSSSKGLTRINNNTVKVISAEWKVKYNEGDIIEFYNSDFSPTGFSSKITKLIYDPVKTEYTMTFENELPQNVANDSILASKSYDSSNYIIRNNNFFGTRVRGILAQAGNGLIEHNTFERTRCAGVQLNTVTESRWSEGRGVSNTIIRDNVFNTCNVSNKTDQFGRGVVYVGTYLDGKTTEFPLHRNIIIENNLFIDQIGRSVSLASCDNVTVQNNIIKNPTSNKLNLKERGKMWVEKASNINILDNKWESSPYIFDFGVGIDNRSVKGLTEENNFTIP